jgi:small GTP-binding protein
MLTIQKKVCLLGDFAVGKTSLIRRYVEGRFDENYLTTVGVVVSRKMIEYTTFKINLLIWDLAGGRDFSESSYLTGTAGAFLVCDLTRTTTLESLRLNAEQVRQANPSVKLFVLANKYDLFEDRVISDEQLFAIAQPLEASLEFTSAKTGYGVEVAFKSVADALMS